jgi:serine/threonine-protein kinase
VDVDVSTNELRPGAILAGRYRVEGQIGAGGMGVVVSAQHLQLGQRVAIKYLPTSWLGDFDAVERFKREAWAAAQIKSPHVVRVSDVATLPSGAPFIVMEYLEGEDLAHVIAKRMPLPLAEITELILQVCEAIAEAHAIGIVHRDLKPSNIFCTRNTEGERVAKVLDFGISKLTGSGWELGITTTRTLLGSPTYMSPEQMHSAKEVDGRTDIWALGVILYELIAGQAPFSASTLPELAIQIATEPPLPLRAAGLDVPVGLERIVSRCLEKDRNKRFPDVGSLAAALTEFAPLTAGLHATRAQRALRGSSSSSQLLAAIPTVRGVGGEADSRPPLREERSGEIATRADRGSGRASAKAGERSDPPPLRSSDKVPRRRRDDEPSGKVATRAARGSGRPGSERPSRRESERPRRESERPRAGRAPTALEEQRSRARKRARPRWLLTAAAAFLVLLLAAVALLYSEYQPAQPPGADAANRAHPTPPPPK